MNLASMMGFILCFGIILLGIATGGGIETALNYVHIPSMLVTFGGAFLAVLATADSFADYVDGLKGFALAVKKPTESTDEIWSKIMELSEMARKEGLLALEEGAEQLEQELLKKGVRLMVDGTEPDLLRDIMETDLDHRMEQKQKQINFWEDLGAMGPAWGMVGTLLGLINMMMAMGDDVESVGSGMGLALITTLYGSMLANWICIPVTRRLKKLKNYDMLIQQLIIEGVLSIQAGENPQVIREKLRTFLTNQEVDDMEERRAA